MESYGKIPQSDLKGVATSEEWRDHLSSRQLFFSDAKSSLSESDVPKRPLSQSDSLYSIKQSTFGRLKQKVSLKSFTEVLSRPFFKKEKGVEEISTFTFELNNDSSSDDSQNQKKIINETKIRHHRSLPKLVSDLVHYGGSCSTKEENYRETTSNKFDSLLWAYLDGLPSIERDERVTSFDSESEPSFTEHRIQSKTPPNSSEMRAWSSYQELHVTSKPDIEYEPSFKLTLQDVFESETSSFASVQTPISIPFQIPSESIASSSTLFITEFPSLTINTEGEIVCDPKRHSRLKSLLFWRNSKRKAATKLHNSSWEIRNLAKIQNNYPDGAYRYQRLLHRKNPGSDEEEFKF